LKSKASLTIAVPALNEESAVEATVRGLVNVARETVETFEVIMIDDGSADGTGRIMDGLTREIPNSRVVHNERPLGVGKAFATALALSTCDYITICPGDNAYGMDLVPEIFRSLGQADFILTYRTNQFESRRFKRFLISKIFSFCMTTLFRVRAKDVHSMNVYPVAQARRVAPIENIGFQVDLVISLLRGNVSKIELPVSLNTNEYKNKSTAFKAKRIVELWRALNKMKKFKPNFD
jgi:dolichol-phosphate mannosyltransferase